MKKKIIRFLLCLVLVSMPIIYIVSNASPTYARSSDDDEENNTEWWNIGGHIVDAIDDMTARVGYNIEAWANERATSGIEECGELGNAMVNNVIFPENNNNFFSRIYTGIKTIIFSFALSIIVLYTLFYGFKVFVLWKDGNPEENPMEIITRYLFALALILTFDEVYKIAGSMFVSMGIKLVQKVSHDYTGSMVGENGSVGVGSMAGASVLTVLFSIVYLFQWLKALFGTLKVGVEMFILRLGFPLACLNIIQPQGNVFNAYVMTFIKNFFTITINLVLINLAHNLWLYGTTLNSQMWALACLFLLNSSKELLSQFLIPQQSGGIGGTIAHQAMQGAGQVIVGAGKKIITKGAV